MRLVGVYAYLWVAFCCGLGSVNCADESAPRLAELQDISPVKRAAAVVGMAQNTDPESYLWLSRALDDPSPIVRIAAVQALAAFQGRDTLGGLVRASRDRDPEVRQAAIVALAKRKDQRALDSLVQSLAEETQTSVRLRLFSSLASKGVSGKTLADKLANRTMDQALEMIKAPSSTQRIKAVRFAGRTVHPQGVHLVTRALGDQDPDVVLAALAELDGRGGKKSLQKLPLLLADAVSEIRTASLDALAHFGKAGLRLAQPALHDPAAEVVLKALAIFTRLDHRPPAHLICRLLVAPNLQVATQSALLLKQQGLHCVLDALQKQLGSDDKTASEGALLVLSTLGTPASRTLLEQHQRQGAKDSLRLWLALARAGSSNPTVLRRLNTQYRKSIEKIKERNETWVTGKIGPLDSSARQPSPLAPNSERTEVTGQLNQQELARLYKKHGLDPPNANSPRSIEDILAKYDVHQDQSDPTKLINPLGKKLIANLSMSLDGLLHISPKQASARLRDVFSLSDPRLLLQVAQVLEAHAIDVEIDPPLAKHLGQALQQADSKQTKALVRILSHNQHAAATQQLLQALTSRSLAKRTTIIQGLANRNAQEVVQSLVAELKGYACVPAAQTLAKGNHIAAIKPLINSLKRAGPAEEMEIHMALATLQDHSQLPELVTKLRSAHAQTRLAAVRVLEKLGGDEAIAAIGQVRWDLDRHVRAEVKRILSRQDNPSRQHR